MTQYRNHERTLAFLKTVEKMKPPRLHAHCILVPDKSVQKLATALDQFHTVIEHIKNCNT